MEALKHTDIGRLDAMIRSAGRICLTAHVHPDGDALGSTYAMLTYLRECIGADACVVLPDRWPDYLSFAVEERWLAHTCIYQEDSDAARSAMLSCDLVICLDFNTLSRVEGLRDTLESCTAPRVLIDHHPGPERQSFGLVISDTAVSSASELLYHVLKAMPGVDGDVSRLPLGLLTLIMTGITTDTNNLANSVFPTTLSACSELIAAGVDRDAILECLYNRYSEQRVRAFGHLLGDSMRVMPQGAAYIVLDEASSVAFGLVRGDTEGLVNIPLGIDSVHMSVFLREEEGVYRVSVRSRAGVEANTFAARYFGGGGHVRAAGGRLPTGGDICSAADAALYVERCIAEYLA